MQPDRRNRIKDVFQAVVDEPPQARAGLLDRACGEDAELRREVEELLGFAEDDAFLGAPIGDVTGAPADPNAGRRLGAWRTLRELGHGGMGSVYLAERVDGEFTQQAALKVIRRSLIDADLERRFRNERQVLASLEHPHIARLLDGGVGDTGEPFFAMEYVDGAPLMTYADREQLGIRARLEIFRRICAAVAYAHGRLVVHRDLKPSNVLVTADGEPKLIDFGLAKLLDAGTGGDRTVTRLRAFTPAYASPEQVQGGQVTTASDVYSLGVVLFELLTGRTPYEVGGGSFAELLRRLESVEPTRPSVMLKRGAADGGARTTRPYAAADLHGDLDNIILMALRREPERRYASAAALGDDVQRYLDGRPVAAHPDSTAYRARKFLRRNAASVALATVAVVAVLAGLGVSIWQAAIARQQRDLATRRFEDVRRLSHSLLFELSPRIERLPGSTATRDLLVRRGLEYLDSLASESAGDPDLQMELAAAYEKIGDLQGNPTNPNLIEYDAAIGSYLKAREIRQAVASRRPPSAAARRALAENYRVLGNIYSQANEVDRAGRDLAVARRLYIEELAAAPDDVTLEIAIAQTMHDLGRHQSSSSRYAGALAPFEHAITTAERVRPSRPGDLDLARLLADSRAQYGLALSWEGRQKDAEREMRLAADIYEPLVAAHPLDVPLRSGLWSVYWLTSTVYEEQDDAKAHQFAVKALDAIRPVAAQDAGNVRARQQLAKSYSRLGQTATNIGRPAEAIVYLGDACAILDEIAAGEPRNGRLRSELALARSRRADALAARGRLDEALADAGQAAGIYADLIARFPADKRSAHNLVLTYSSIGDIHARTNPAAAERSYRQAVALLAQMRTHGQLSGIDEKLETALRGKLARLSGAE
jgi:non-specific serine/threonine protein kinase/serine/threonine-protein kinase